MKTIQRLTLVGMALVFSGCTITLPGPAAQAPQAATPPPAAVQTVIVVATPTAAPQAAAPAPAAGGQAAAPAASGAAATTLEPTRAPVQATAPATNAGSGTQPASTLPTAGTGGSGSTSSSGGNSSSNSGGGSATSGDSGQANPPTGSLVDVPKVIEDRDASYVYSVSVIGKDERGAAYSENFRVEMVNFPDRDERLIRLTGANLPRLRRISDNQAFPLGSAEFYVKGGESYLLVELPNADRVCATLLPSDAELLMSYSPRQVLPAVEPYIADLIQNHTTSLDEDVDGVPVTTYIATNRNGEVLSASVTSAGQLAKVIGAFNGEIYFLGRQVLGDMLVDFETRLTGLSPIILPDECTTNPNPDYKLERLPTSNA